MTNPRRIASWFLALSLGFAGVPALADEGGVSFWLPGQFASFAAAPAASGWSLGTVYFHSSVDASRSKSFPLGGQVVGGIDARADLIFVAPTYTFAEKIAGGQAAISLVGAYGRSRVSADVFATDALGASVSTSESDTTRGGADLYPLGTLKWNFGVHNTMAYAMADIPVGSYRAGRLANIGIGHAAMSSIVEGIFSSALPAVRWYFASMPRERRCTGSVTTRSMRRRAPQMRRPT